MSKYDTGRVLSDAWPMRSGLERSDYAPLECSEQQTGGFVYVLGSENGQKVKIGHSKDPDWGRIKQHQKGDAFGEGGNFTILAVVRATRHAESALKSAFRAHRSYKQGKTEVFSAEPLIDYIAWLRDQYYVSTTREEFESECGRTVVEPLAWLPSPQTISKRRSERTLLIAADPWSVLPSRDVTGDDYYTPQPIMQCVREALGGYIDLDPASHVIANRIVRAERFYTKDQHGENLPWFGRVWLNPPFSDWPVFINKVLREADSGNCEAMVLLGAVRTLTAQYFKPLLSRADAFCIISGRIPFWGMKTDSESPTDGHFLLYIGPNMGRFVSAVSQLGVTWAKPAAA